MDKGLRDECSSISSSSATITNSSSSNSNSNRDMYLKQINKSSHKISKPTIRNPSIGIGIPPPMAAMTMNLDPPNPPPQSQQPPVYNINKNDFRDVVQKLTGSPAHERPPTPVTQPRPPSSRLQRIRPPPLAQISNRPPPQPQILSNDAGQPFPPLPPLPSVHPAAESPISAYMRFLQTSSPAPAPSPLWNGGIDVGQRMESPVSAYMRFLQSSVHSSSPRWNGVAPPLANAQQQQQPSSAFPLSPTLPFGCSIPSPRSTYGMLSPSFLLSPTQLSPLSPTLPLPIPSPRWKGGM